MAIDIKIDKTSMEAIVLVKGVEAKREKLDKDSYRDYMVELSGDNLEVMRKVNRLFKPKSYEFKGVK